MMFRVFIFLSLLSFRASGTEYLKCIEMLRIANTHFYSGIQAAGNISFLYYALTPSDCTEAAIIPLARLAEAMERYDFYTTSAKVTSINIQNGYVVNECSLDLALQAADIIERVNKLRLKYAVVVKEARMALGCSEVFR